MATPTQEPHQALGQHPSPEPAPAQRLRTTLRVNAATSAAGGLVAALAPSALDDVLGTGHPGWVRLVGAGLVVFALDVVIVSGLRTARLRRFAAGVVVADASWVAATVLAVALGWFSIAGAVVMSIVAAVVATFAVLQTRSASALRGAAEGPEVRR